MTTTTNKQAQKIAKEIRALLIDLKKGIDDDYRCSDDPDDTTPGMLVTVATNDMTTWNYQTGDTSYTGGCYGLRHWSSICLERRSNCTELANDAVNELADLCAEELSQVPDGWTVPQFAKAKQKCAQYGVPFVADEWTIGIGGEYRGRCFGESNMFIGIEKDGYAHS